MKVVELGRDALSLPQVTLCAVASKDPVPALAALERSRAMIDFGDVLLITARVINVPDDCRLEVIQEFASIEGYSRFILKELYRYINTDYVLIVQWDGFVLDPRRWDTAFLEYDYIGAPWPQYESSARVGNGGFSLRSRRLLAVTAGEDVPFFHPEDVAICRNSRRLLEDQHAIRFAPPEVAERFAFERGPPGRTFGFHGSFNFPLVFGGRVLPVVRSLPDSMFLSRDGRDLCRAMAASGDAHVRSEARRLARALLRRRPFDRRYWHAAFQAHLGRRLGLARLRHLWVK